MDARDGTGGDGGAEDGATGFGVPRREQQVWGAEEDDTQRI